MSVCRVHSSAVLVALLIAFAYDAVSIILVLFGVHAVDFLKHVVFEEVYQRVAISTSKEQVIVIMAQQGRTVS